MLQSQQKRMLDDPVNRLDTFESDGDLDDTKKLAQEANMGRNEAMSTGKVSDIYTEVNTLNEILSKELKLKDKSIESLKVELEKAKQELLDKEASLGKSKEELDSMKSFESKALSLFAESEQRFQELDDEIENRKESEKKMFDSFSAQTKELEQTKMQLVQSKLEIDSLHSKLKKLEASSEQKPLGDAVEDVVRPQENESVESLHEQIRLLKNELQLATEAEENSKKALDDLALALKEVATEANQMKENLASTQEQLERAKVEVEQYKSKFDELKKEAELYKNTSERLRIEAEDSVLAWSGKEAGFVECIRRAEAERDAAQRENAHLLESLKAAENAIKTGKQENNNLRDILKQALNEANVSKEAARIATAENSGLKDALHEKQQALEFISQENENLKMNEAAACDSIKELKRLVYQGANKDSKLEDTEPSQELQPQNSIEKEQSEGRKKLLSEFGFNIKELKIPFKSNSVDKDGDEDPNDEDCDSSRADPLKGSIFDTDSPVAPTKTHHRTKSSADGSDAVTSDDLDGLDGAQFDDESDKNNRKKKALLRRFGDLLMRRNYHRKEPSLE